MKPNTKAALFTFVLLVLMAGVAQLLAPAEAATQNKNQPWDDTSVVNDHGGYARQPNGSYNVECCGVVKDPSGEIIPVKSACVTVNGPLAVATFTTCQSTWRTTNGY